MFPALLGKKIGMTQVYDEAGILSPVTVVQAGPCTVLQVKTDETDGYTSVQLGFGEKKLQRSTKPEIGHAKKASATPAKFVREIRAEEFPDGTELGATLDVNVFDGIKYVDVVGTSKGKGFAGVMKRHNFGGLGDGHGVQRKHRTGGSINGHGTNLGTGPTLKKGKRMSGHMGHETCTSRNHALIRIDSENGLLLIKGPVPGPNGGYVVIRTSKTAKAKA
ncbi:MAG: 50S ribosomal protein L3 [Phycisphaerales bacterium]|jgi:large subunit ribosomal protein L3|nr:50S ribosomal protein L3 [Phycisphaerales bacterium]MBT7171548.1 50S ribosomal protein L3 [Phycisphaerales bacterium]